MKKFAVIFAIVMTLVIMFSFAACKKTATCGLCGETKTSNFHKVTEGGESVELCDDCYQLYKAAKEAFGG